MLGCSRSLLLLLAGGLGAVAPVGRVAALPPPPQEPANCNLTGPGNTYTQVAAVSAGALVLIEVRGCNGSGSGATSAQVAAHARMLVARGVRLPVGFSPNGRWVAYGAGAVANVASGSVGHPLGRNLGRWAWLGRGRELAATTRRGGVVAGAPGHRRVVVLPDGWGATGLIASPTGQIALTRAAPPGRAGAATIWTVSPRDATPRLVYRAPNGTRELQLARFAPDGRSIVFWTNSIGSASIAADGLPLHVVAPGGQLATLAQLALAYPSWITACAGRLAFVAGPDRETTVSKRVEIAAAPAWNPTGLSSRSQSAISPACSPDGHTIAVASTVQKMERAGREHRSIELLDADHPGRATILTRPPAGSSDESPLWIDDGRLVLFVRRGMPSAADLVTGTLYVTGATAGAKPTRLSAVGPVGDFFGAEPWSSAIAVKPAT